MSWPMKRWLEYTMYVSMKINFRHGCFVYIKLYVCYDSHFKEDLDFMETKNISVQLSSQCIKIGGPLYINSQTIWSRMKKSLLRLHVDVVYIDYATKMYFKIDWELWLMSRK
jgi:hypothetical protein